VRKLFGRDLPLAALFEGATVENLAALIRRGGASAWSPLVAVQPGGHKPPFFCVHPAGGNVICYAALARELGAAQPFYGLQARGLDGRDEPFTRLEEMADYYVEAVRGVRPEGPYLLGGWSLGGAVAFEMARQLGERGQEVALLALLDSPAPHASQRGVEVDEAELLAGLGEDLGLHVSAEDLRGLTTDERLALFLEHGRARALVPSDYDLAQARRLLHVYETNIRAFGNYRPQPAATRIILHRAGEAAGADSHGAPHPSAADPTLGWGALSTAPVEVRRVPGDHVSMLSEPHVKTLAAELGRLLEEASAATAGAARTAFDIKTQGA
jgi:thioesterase domain-containing protein